ncbi:hypothetical protein C1H46_020704 [Malus baccata]|uniref:DUF7642 domain-containing protein n=1 Tax=Malus baccata TaxID=106549 RepID=A0A540M4M4_MALBA|nr:hypothetical protein C1H46_020704 [Malus baccata]
MGTRNDLVEIDSLEEGLLSEAATEAEGEEPVLYSASFQEKEENFVKYQTARWLLYSGLLVLAWGIGIFMLLYLPVRRYILRKDIRSRKLYLTPNAIVYKYAKPVPFPIFGVLKKEKHFLLPSVADVVIEQGYLQSLFGVYSLRIEHVGVRRPASDDVQIHGIANPSAFRKAVLMRLSSMTNEVFSRQISTLEDIPNLKGSPSKSLRYGDLVLLQKLEEVGSSVKRVQTILEEQHPQTPEPTDGSVRRVLNLISYVLDIACDAGYAEGGKFHVRPLFVQVAYHYHVIITYLVCQIQDYNPANIIHSSYISAGAH